MSTQHVRFRSASLGRNGEFFMHLPDRNLPEFMTMNNPHYRRPAKTLILLHGYSGDATDWLYNSPAADYSMKYNLAVVMPSGGLNFYVDRKPTGRQYCRFIGEDLIGYLRDTYGLALKREDTLIGGLSMGGFGALHTGLMYPETFGGIMALSSALIIYELKNMKPDTGAPAMANYEYYVDTFGDLKEAEGSDHNPEVLFERNLREGRDNPPIYMACGSEDFLLKANHTFRDFLKEKKADFIYSEGPGVHDWQFWSPHGYEGIEWLLKKV